MIFFRTFAGEPKLYNLMTRLSITNVGPLRQIDFEIKRYNFFIGPQSSGKSTIAKVMSHCFWLEKEVAVHPYYDKDLSYYEDNFVSQVENFHNIHGYFDRELSSICFESDYVKICMENGKCSIEKKRKIKDYERKKVLYIPAERNVAVFSDSINGYNHIKNFAIDWINARDYYDADNKFGILNLGMDYYREQSNKRTINKIVAKNGKDSYEIQLTDASSGLQSVVPMVTAVSFYTSMFYRQGIETKLMTPEQENTRIKVKNFLYENLDDANDVKKKKAVEDRVVRLTNTKRTSFIIEEPESNLYPSTQRDLLNFIIRCSSAANRKHSVTITTHSPYVINQLNLLLKAHDKGEKIGGAAIDFGELNVFALQDGKARDLKVKNDGVHLIDTDSLSEDINDIYDIYEGLK